jgi:hypothetical protein
MIAVSSSEMEDCSRITNGGGKMTDTVVHAAPSDAVKNSTPLSTNVHLLRWVEKIAELTQPDKIHWVDGSEEENQRLCAELVEAGTFTALNPELWPGCFYARSDAGDVARVEERTFICSLAKDNAGPTNNWEEPHVMRKRLKGLFSGSMRGRTMYVLPFSMGAVGSPMSQIGVELTDSPYVVVNMRIMTRIGLPVFKEIDKDSKQVVPCVLVLRSRPVRRTLSGPATRKSTSSTFPRAARSGRMVRATAATLYWARSASPYASPRTLPATKAGWPSTCSSSGWRVPMARRPMWRRPSPAPAARPTSPC